MNVPHLPGLPTMAALMLASVLSAWLGLWGPIDLNKLKDWQPLMAAMIALGAGTLAYRGAMAKVNLDRENIQRDINSRKLGLYRRLNYRMNTLKHRVNSASDAIERFHNDQDQDELTKTALELPSIKELDEAWEKLDLFPIDAIGGIDALRFFHPVLAESLDNMIAVEKKIVRPPSPRATLFLERYQALLDRMRRAIAMVEASLNREMKAFN